MYVYAKLTIIMTAYNIFATKYLVFIKTTTIINVTNKIISNN